MPRKTNPETATTTSTRAPRKTAVKKTTKTPAKRATKTTPDVNESAAQTTETAEGKSVTLRGRSVFLVQTTAAGVTVRTAWMSEDKQLRDMPAVFPDVDYAVNLIDDLKRQVLKHFSEAAQVGARAIAQQRASKKSTTANR